jgi:sulfatase maturation enzyme AslB (radical SAM superfamily)
MELTVRIRIGKATSILGTFNSFFRKLEFVAMHLGGSIRGLITVVKPFVQQSSHQGYQMKEPPSPSMLEEVFARLEQLQDRSFTVVVRRNAFEGYGQRNYRHCLGTSFITAINSGGDVASCLPYWDQPDYVYGNIYEASFDTIWQGISKSDQTDHRTRVDVCQVCPPIAAPMRSTTISAIRQPSAKHVNFV